MLRQRLRGPSVPGRGGFVCSTFIQPEELAQHAARDRFAPKATVCVPFRLRSVKRCAVLLVVRFAGSKVTNIEVTGTGWVRRCAEMVRQRKGFKLHIPDRWRARRAFRLLGYESPSKVPILLSYSIPLIAGTLGAAIDARYKLTPQQQLDGLATDSSHAVLSGCH